MLEKIKVNELLFFCSLFVFTALAYLNQIESIRLVLSYATYVALGLLALSFVLNIRHYSGLQIVAILSMTVVSLAAVVINGNYGLLKLSLLLSAMKGIEIDRCIRFDLVVRAFFIAFVVCLSTLGVAQDVVYSSASGAMKHSMGFTNPNSLGMAVMILSLEILYLNREKSKLSPMLIVVCLLAWMDYWTGCRTASMMIVISLLIALAYKRSYKLFSGSKFMQFAAKHATSFLFVLTWVLVACYIFGFSWTYALDDVLTGRLHNLAVYVDRYHLTLFGADVSDAGITLDSTYGYMIFGYGLFVTVAFLLAYPALIAKLQGNGRYFLCAIMFCFAIYGLSERLWMFAEYNVFMLSFSILLYGDIGKGDILARNNKQKSRV